MEKNPPLKDYDLLESMRASLALSQQELALASAHFNKIWLSTLIAVGAGIIQPMAGVIMLAESLRQTVLYSRHFMKHIKAVDQLPECEER